MGRLKRTVLKIIVICLTIGNLSLALDFAGVVDLKTCIWGPWGSEALLADEIIFLTDDVVVPEGITLKILPGTKIIAKYIHNPVLSADNLYSGLEISIYGALEALGKTDSPICFQGLEPSRSIWQGIFSLGTVKLEHAFIRDAVTGVTSSGGQMQLENCMFSNNQTAIALWGWQISKINKCSLTNNIDGIATASTPATITANVIENNDVGIKILLGEVGPLIKNNTFLHNHTYHIYNLSVSDIIAYPNNWDLPLEQLEGKLFDGYMEPEAGLIIYREP